jgi:hypothetical protein
MSEAKFEEKKNTSEFFGLLHPERMKQRKFLKNFLLLNPGRDETRQGKEFSGIFIVELLIRAGK